MTTTAPAEATVIGGTVVAHGLPVRGAFVRLLDARGEFAAEVVTGRDGGFRLFAAPGRWTLRALAPGGAAVADVHARPGWCNDVVVELAPQ